MKIGSLVWLLWELKVAVDLYWENKRMAFIVKKKQKKKKLLQKWFLSGPLPGR